MYKAKERGVVLLRVRFIVVVGCGDDTTALEEVDVVPQPKGRTRERDKGGRRPPVRGLRVRW